MVKVLKVPAFLSWLHISTFVATTHQNLHRGIKDINFINFIKGENGNLFLKINGHHAFSADWNFWGLLEVFLFEDDYCGAQFTMFKKTKLVMTMLTLQAELFATISIT